jgi:hypothetical protein
MPDKPPSSGVAEWTRDVDLAKSVFTEQWTDV